MFVKEGVAGQREPLAIGFPSDTFVGETGVSGHCEMEGSFLGLFE